MTVNTPVALWDRLVDEFVRNDRESLAKSDFFQPGVDRVALVRNALSRPGGNSRAVAVTLLKRMNHEEQKELFPQLVQLARAAHGPVGAVREIIQSLPREWVLTRIDAEVEEILEKEEYDDYWMFLELYAALDTERALKLARRAANHPDPDIRELALRDSPMFQSGSGPTTQIGYVNRNNQRCEGHRGVAGTDHGALAYRMVCLEPDCRLEYGANGQDVFQRKCPSCQGGEPGITY